MVADDPAGFSYYDNAERTAFVDRERVLIKAVVLQLAREVRNNVDKSLSAKPGTIRAIISTARSTLVNELSCPPLPPHPMREIFSSITAAYVKRHGQIALLRKKKKGHPAISLHSHAQRVRHGRQVRGRLVGGFLDDGGSGLRHVPQHGLAQVRDQHGAPR